MKARFTGSAHHMRTGPASGPGRIVMGQRGKAIVAGQMILAVLALVFALVPASAGEPQGHQRGERERDAIVHGTRLYEVTETVHFGANGLRKTRDAAAVLMGFAPLGTPLCPTKALVTNPETQTCTVTGIGQDSVSLITGIGPVSGTFAVVINAPGNSDVHVPDLPLLTGTFSGENDLSRAVAHGVPLGSIRGSFIFDGDPKAPPVPFTGTYRLPFALDRHGKAKEPDDEREDVFYLGDDGRLIPVRPFERVLGFPPVRLEVKF
jgi:hypothetical protein